MTTDNDLDQSISPWTDQHLRQEPALLVNGEDATRFQNELSMDIVKLVRAHLKKAQIKGIISAETRDRLLRSHIADLRELENSNRHKQLQDRLQTLERMQEQLVHAYHENLGQLQMEIQQFQNISAPNELAVHRNSTHIPQNPRHVPEPQQSRVRRTVTPRLKRNRKRKIPHVTVSSISKYAFPIGIISGLTTIGIRFGMTIFMVIGALMILGTLLIRFITKQFNLSASTRVKHKVDKE